MQRILNHIYNALDWLILTWFKLKTFKPFFNIDKDVHNNIPQPRVPWYILVILKKHYKIFLIVSVALAFSRFFSRYFILTSMKTCTDLCLIWRHKKSCSVCDGRLLGGAWSFGTVVSSCALSLMHSVRYTILKTMDRYCSYDTWTQPSWSVSYCLKTSVNLCRTIQHWMKSSNATCPFLWRSNFSISVP